MKFRYSQLRECSSPVDSPILTIPLIVVEWKMQDTMLTDVAFEISPTRNKHQDDTRIVPTAVTGQFPSSSGELQFFRQLVSSTTESSLRNGTEIISLTKRSRITSRHQ